MIDANDINKRFDNVFDIDEIDCLIDNLITISFILLTNSFFFFFNLYMVAKNIT